MAWISINKNSFNNNTIYTHLLGPGKGSFFLPAGIAKVTRKSITIIPCLISFSLLILICFIYQNIPISPYNVVVYSYYGQQQNKYYWLRHYNIIIISSSTSNRKKATLPSPPPPPPPPSPPLGNVRLLLEL